MVFLFWASVQGYVQTEPDGETEMTKSERKHEINAIRLHSPFRHRQAIIPLVLISQSQQCQISCLSEGGPDSHLEKNVIRAGMQRVPPGSRGSGYRTHQL